MSDESFLLYQLVQKDPRYPMQAYLFVREALAFAADSLELDAGYDDPVADEAVSEDHVSEELPVVSKSAPARHVTGQQLCEGIRQYAINQFGYMAKVVLKNWGIEKTSCFGDIVYNMIEVGIMRKSDEDRRHHFDDVYQFEDVFQKEFEINDSLAQRRA
jgi:uncharacterized repeat protein (TIGR04138 family)